MAAGVQVVRQPLETPHLAAVHLRVALGASTAGDLAEGRSEGFDVVVEVPRRTRSRTTSCALLGRAGRVAVVPRPSRRMSGRTAHPPDPGLRPGGAPARAAWAVVDPASWRRSSPPARRSAPVQPNIFWNVPGDRRAGCTAVCHRYHDENPPRFESNRGAKPNELTERSAFLGNHLRPSLPIGTTTERARTRYRCADTGLPLPDRRYRGAIERCRSPRPAAG